MLLTPLFCDHCPIAADCPDHKSGHPCSLDPSDDRRTFEQTVQRLHFQLDVLEQQTG
jgi:hypothetical protein